MGVLGETLLYEVDRGVATIAMNRPDAGNALLADQRDVMVDLLAAASGDFDIRAVALRANGRHFCTGADVGAIADAQSSQLKVGEGMGRIQVGAQRLIAAVLDCRKPVVAVVQGPAAGLGAHLAFACDLVVAAESAYFLEPFLLRGLVVDGGGAYLLPRLVGLQRAKELAFLGDKLPASDARDLGLVNRVVPSDVLDATAEELLSRLAAAPTSALSFTKQLFNTALDVDRSTAFLAEAMAVEVQSHSYDYVEGVTAFMERRDPGYRGH